MKSTEFNKNFSINRSSSSNGLRAVPKKVSDGLPEVKTADGEIFNDKKKYFFFDPSNGKIRQTSGIRRIDSDWLGSRGLRVVKIENIYGNRDSALSAGQRFYESEVERLRKLIADFEVEKVQQIDELTVCHTIQTNLTI